VEFPGRRGTLTALDHISFDVARGEVLGIVGESGAGKSTVARMVVGLLAPSAGSVSFNGTRVGAPGWDQHRRRVQMVFQDPYASLNPRWRVAWIVAEPIRTFGLDVSVQAQVLNLMRNLQRELSLTYLLISHDLAVVRHMSDKIGVMYLGRLVEKADKKRLFDAPQHPYTRMLLDAVPRLDDAGSKLVAAAPAIADEIPNPIDPPSSCPYHPRCPRRMSICEEVLPELEAKSGSYVACHAVE
jgi:oligopeptide/dipeptide ABC transporter ATP-binding protein